MFQENARLPQVKMIELKLSQGAKPAHGGMLPAEKVVLASETSCRRCWVLLLGSAAGCCCLVLLLGAAAGCCVDMVREALVGRWRLTLTRRTTCFARDAPRWWALAVFAPPPSH